MSERPLIFSDPGRLEIYCHFSPPTVYPEEAHATVQICVPLEQALYSVTRQSETGRALVHHLGARDVLVVPAGQPLALHVLRHGVRLERRPGRLTDAAIRSGARPALVSRDRVPPRYSSFAY